MFSILFPILALSCAGFLSARLGFLNRAECETISRFTFSLVIPCLLFINTANSDIPDDFGASFLLAYYIAVLLVYVLSLYLSNRLYGYDSREQATFAMATSYSNTTIVGIPMVLQTLGQEALLPLFLIIAIQNLVLFTVGTLAAERSQLQWTALFTTLLKMLRQLVSNPLTASLIAGLAFNLLGLGLWPPLEDSVRLMSTAAIPTALFVLGTSLHQYRVRGQIQVAVVMTGMKILVLPVLVYILTFHVFDIERLWAVTAVLASSMPVGVSAYVFASRYQCCQAPVAAGSVISAVACLVPVMLILGLLA